MIELINKIRVLTSLITQSCGEVKLSAWIAYRNTGNKIDELYSELYSKKDAEALKDLDSKGFVCHFGNRFSNENGHLRRQKRDKKPMFCSFALNEK